MCAIGYRQYRQGGDGGAFKLLGCLLGDVIEVLEVLGFSRTGSLTSGCVDLIGDEDPTDEDGDIGMGDSTGVSAPLGGEIFSGEKKYREIKHWDFTSLLGHGLDYDFRVEESCEDEMKGVLFHIDAVIVNGDAPTITSASAGTEGLIPPKTDEQKLARKNELKAKITLLLAIPDEHLLKFHGI
ncbi:hypothetical protein Tco_0003862 [Tanacetum coccineum]